MKSLIATVGSLAAANPSLIATSQSLASAGFLALTASIIDKPRRVSITSSGNDTSVVFTIKGLDVAGQTISESINGGNAASVSSVLDYASVISIFASAITTNITVGTNSTAASRWVRLDEYAPAQMQVQIKVKGVVEYVVQHTQDDPNSFENPVDRAAVVWDTNQTTMAFQNVSTTLSLSTSPKFMRILLNSGIGSIVGTFTQYSTVPK